MYFQVVESRPHSAGAPMVAERTLMSSTLMSSERLSDRCSLQQSSRRRGRGGAKCVWSSKHRSLRASIDQISWENTDTDGSIDDWCLVKRKPLTSCSRCTEWWGRWRGGGGGRGRRPVPMRGTTTRWPRWQPWILRETGRGGRGSKEVSHVVHLCRFMAKKRFSGYLLMRSYTCFNPDWSRERRPLWSGRGHYSEPSLWRTLHQWEHLAASPAAVLIKFSVDCSLCSL